MAALPAVHPAPTLVPLASLDRTALLQRFWRMSPLVRCELCNQEPYRSSPEFGYRCPHHRDDYQAVLDREWEAYYLSEGHPPHYQDRI